MTQISTEWSSHQRHHDSAGGKVICKMAMQGGGDLRGELIANFGEPAIREP